jgi:hypothetical protein
MAFDSDRFLLDAANAFHAARTEEELDKAWADIARPVYDQVPEPVLSIATRLYTLNQMVIIAGLRHVA